MDKEKKSGDNKELLKRVLRRSKIMIEADDENRKLAIDDMKFVYVPGEQWDEYTKRERGKDRPMYEFNKVRVTVKRIINDMRSNRPMGKVRASEDGDKPTANVLEGLLRNIWANADGDTVIDYAAEYQVAGGMGAWRVTVDYADDEAFDQVIGIDPIRNPFCLYSDPSAQDFLKRDANDWFLADRISKESYERRWPDKEVISFESDDTFDSEDWDEEDEKVRIGEYWWKEPVTKNLCLLGNGMTVDKEDPNITPELIEQAGGVVKERAVRSNKIMMCIASGESILEGPVEWAGSMFPFIQVYGEYVVIEGKVLWFGLTRFAKDAQRSYNYSRTNAIESVALAPQAKYWATPDQAKGHVDSWAESNKKNYPFMLYNADAKAPGPPQRMGSADVPVALVQEMQISSEDIKGVTGIYDASLGAQGNETSGRAINARQRQGEVATFNYMDNMAKGIRRTWEILVDLVPKIYDTPRSIRILGVDGSEDYAKINTIDPNTGQAINDVSRGKYDVAVTVGPSFATLRQEAAEAYGEIASRDPNVMMAAGDLVFKAMDLPYAEQIAERMQAMLPPPIQQLIGKGKQMPPEVTAAMAQVDQAMRMVAEKGQLVTAAEQELKELEAKVKGDAASAKLAQASLTTQEAQLQSQLDSAKGDLALAQQKLEADKAIFAKEVENAMLKIQLAQLKATHAVTESIHHHENTERNVNDAVKDGQVALKDQATSNAVATMQAEHKQQMSEAKASKTDD